MSTIPPALFPVTFFVLLAVELLLGRNVSTPRVRTDSWRSVAPEEIYHDGGSGERSPLIRSANWPYRTLRWGAWDRAFSQRILPNESATAAREGSPSPFGVQA